MFFNSCDAPCVLSSLCGGSVRQEGDGGDWLIGLNGQLGIGVRNYLVLRISWSLSQDLAVRHVLASVVVQSIMLDYLSLDRSCRQTGGTEHQEE